MADKTETVRVVVRCRPLNQKEISDGRQRIVDMDTSLGQVSVKNPKGDSGEPPKVFTFDQVFNWDSAQREVYDSTAQPIVSSVMEGFNGTIFAYGQTGTGKTHTMDGGPTPEQQGIIPNSFNHIFQAIDASEGVQYLVRASFLEIYNEEIRDLLSKNPKDKLDLKESKDSGVYVKGLNSFVVKNVPEIRNVLEVGKKNRSVGATAMNQDSSRSHSIFTITIETFDQSVGKDGSIRVGKLNLVDLAGSERQSKTGATGDRLKEGIKINLSLTALGNVISALVDGKSAGHIPYRDSKLTRLLQDSLGGNTKTVMVANLGPADWNFDETLSTLRYANRAKNIKNKPKVNEDPKDAMLREFQEEIKRLKAALEAADGDTVLDADGQEVVERVVEKEASLKQQDLERIRQEMEDQMRAELGPTVDSSQLEAVREEARRKAEEDMRKMDEERCRAEVEAAQLAAEKDEHAQHLNAKKEAAMKARAEKEALAKKLKTMESKLLKGEKKGGLVEITKQKEEELARKRKQLEERQRKQEEEEQRILELEEKTLATEEKYSSLQEEANEKTKKLKKLYKRFQEVSAEVEDLYAEWQREKESLNESVRMLQQQMQLKDMVLDAFVPPEEVHKVMRRAHWDDERELWVLERLSDAGREDKVMRRPVSASGLRRPTSDYTRIVKAMGDLNPRFRSDNILNLELDLPERTTFDYIGPGADSRVQDALNAAFADDGEMLFVGNQQFQNVFLADAEGYNDNPRRPSSAKKGRPPSAKQRTRPAQPA